MKIENQSERLSLFYNNLSQGLGQKNFGGRFFCFFLPFFPFSLLGLIL
jgi:hypothetical protein